MRSELTRWNPLHEMLGLPDEMSNLVRVFFRDLDGELVRMPGDGAWRPPVDIEEHESAFRVSADMPGLSPEEISVIVEDDTLTLSGERKLERSDGKGGARRYERVVGRFQRSFALPTGVDGGGVKAAYKDGVLTLTLPKREHAKPKQISVKVE